MASQATFESRGALKIEPHGGPVRRCSRRISCLFLAFTVGLTNLADGQTPRPTTPFQPVVPKAWDDAALAGLELPLAAPTNSPKHVSADYYYRIRVRRIHQSYPIYHPDKEPPGYQEKLRRLEPVILWDDRGTRPPLKTEADWIAAGSLVFESPIAIDVGRIAANSSWNLVVREPAWHRDVGAPVTSDGVLPFYRYVIRDQGKVELGVLSCAMCHTRVMPDGSVIKGAQGNLPFDRAFAYDLRDKGALLDVSRRLERQLYGAPWVRPDSQAQMDAWSLEQIALPHAVIPAGTLARHGTSPLSPVQVPDLIGIRERRYLDRTGLQQHRDIADLMRYAALNQGGDDLSTFGDFVPLIAMAGKMPSPGANPFGRYNDEQLYALALYLYSLAAPANPNAPASDEHKALARRGSEIFHDSENRCAACHKPPLYTNNKLVRAPGFELPDNHPAHDDVLSQRVNTDPTLTLTTRRGTGLYKVPSLLGVWYRGPFEHNGSVATLEDWFDERRLRDDYVPTGWKGPPGTATRAVKGHEYGLDLPARDKKALIAFLKTL